MGGNCFCFFVPLHTANFLLMDDNKKKTKKKPPREQQEPREHKAHWREVYAGVEEIEAFLDGRIMLRRNALTGLVESRWPAEYPGETHAWEPLSSVTVNTLWGELSRQKPVRKQDLQNVIESQYVGEYHPFRQYLEHLPPWDGRCDAIRPLSMTVRVCGGMEEQLLFYEYLRKWLVWMVVGANITQKLSTVMLGRAFKELGFQGKTSRNVRGYIVVRRQPDEMRALRQQMATDDTDTDDTDVF